MNIDKTRCAYSFSEKLFCDGNDDNAVGNNDFDDDDDDDIIFFWNVWEIKKVQLGSRQRTEREHDAPAMSAKNRKKKKKTN